MTGLKVRGKATRQTFLNAATLGDFEDKYPTTTENHSVVKRIDKIGLRQCDENHATMLEMLKMVFVVYLQLGVPLSCDWLNFCSHFETMVSASSRPY